MKQRQFFPQYHPAVLVVYLLAAVFCTMFAMNPEYIAISFACAGIYAIILMGAQKYFRTLRMLAVLFFITVFFNLLTNRQSGEVLFRIGSFRLTLESLIFGACMGGMLAAAIVWFSCFNHLISGDKLIFLLGKSMPTTAMILSMILKLAPETARKYREISDAQRVLQPMEFSKTDNGGNNVSLRGTFGRKVEAIRRTAKICGALMSRAMEDGVETADAMRARGYGSGFRTRYKQRTFRPRDVFSLTVLAILFTANFVWIVYSGKTEVSGEFLDGSPAGLLMGICYIAMLLYPLTVEIVPLASRKSEIADSSSSPQ
jgi:energy-coupling factor transport system permease protein